MSLPQNCGKRREGVCPCLKLPRLLLRKAQRVSNSPSIFYPLQGSESLSSIEGKHPVKLFPFYMLLLLLPSVGRENCSKLESLICHYQMTINSCKLSFTDHFPTLDHLDSSLPQNPNPVRHDAFGASQCFIKGQLRPLVCI